MVEENEEVFLEPTRRRRNRGSAERFCEDDLKREGGIDIVE